jgi:hypothetical protein
MSRRLLAAYAVLFAVAFAAGIALAAAGLLPVLQPRVKPVPLAAGAGSDPHDEAGDGATAGWATSVTVTPTPCAMVTVACCAPS